MGSLLQIVRRALASRASSLQTPSLRAFLIYFVTTSLVINLGARSFKRTPRILFFRFSLTY
ncbi:MAG: hypothetical protein QXI22_07200 [Sulfolobales archaeon]